LKVVGVFVRFFSRFTGGCSPSFCVLMEVYNSSVSESEQTHHSIQQDSP
jgi:hypothetical protein